MYCEGEGRSGMIRHDDHDRGVSYAYLEGVGPGGSHYNYVSPDFFRLVPWEGEGLRPMGYGFDSIEGIVETALRVEAATQGLSADEALKERRSVLTEVDERGIIATPANSSVNELAIAGGKDSRSSGTGCP